MKNINSLRFWKKVQKQIDKGKKICQIPNLPKDRFISHGICAASTLFQYHWYQLEFRTQCYELAKKFLSENTHWAEYSVGKEYSPVYLFCPFAPTAVRGGFVYWNIQRLQRKSKFSFMNLIKKVLRFHL